MSYALPIPPLAPLPNANANTNATPDDSKDDLFLTLLNPSTPRASPTFGPIPNNALKSVPENALNRHTRTVSTDSDFGAFVSVAPTEDPLLHTVPEGGQADAFGSLQNFEFFDRFTENAKQATEKNKQQVLDEILHHEDDPLYFLDANSSQQPSKPSTPIPIIPPIQSTADEDPLDWLRSADSSSSNVAELPSAGEVLSSSSSGSPLELKLDERIQQSRHPRRQNNLTDQPHIESLMSTSPHLRSPSLPPSSPTRISMPEIQRTQSFFVPSSLTAPSFPSRWVSSFLSRQSSPPQRPSPSKSPSEITILPSSTRVASPSLEISHSRAHTIIAPPAPEITHGTPFASHPYIPPSGAPGFTGDRTWNTAGFEFDKENVEKKSVKLLGRKEVTSPVLTVELANKLRPHFPALSRLPGSWTLLYSLDQHGISLKTLYSKCDSHLGGTLIIMRDTNEAVFGAWMGEGVHPSKGSYYGSGESFLWKEMSDHKVKIFKWTGKNDYFALCEPDYISFGGGEGRYGLYLDDTLSEGSSARCPTFDNDPLCSDGPRQGGSTTFECVGVEVWGVG